MKNDSVIAIDPPKDCSLCPKLVEHRSKLQKDHPSWHNAPVPAFGDPAARLLIVGLAPGENGANRTGRVFTGDSAGETLYRALDEFGFTRGTYNENGDDDLQLVDCAITNAVACAPREHKVIADEISNCRQFLSVRIRAMHSLCAILVLGKEAHNSVLNVFGVPRKDMPFVHGVEYCLTEKIRFFVSYHCSVRNIKTKKLGVAELHEIFASLREHLDSIPAGSTLHS